IQVDHSHIVKSAITTRGSTLRACDPGPSQSAINTVPRRQTTSRGPSTMLSESLSAISDLVDTERYPLEQLDQPAMRDQITQYREQLERLGCLVLPGFIRPEAL